jgi:hypothetical protein
MPALKIAFIARFIEFELVQLFCHDFPLCPDAGFRPF